MDITKWKNDMKKVSSSKNMDIQEVYQRYILEEFAKKISHSDYKDQFIFKGGFIVSTILGFDTRTTRDIDITYKSVIYSEKEIHDILTEVCLAPSPSVFTYELIHLKENQLDDRDPGYTATIKASLQQTRFSLKLDISNNTLIFPEAIRRNLDSIFGTAKIDVYTYHLESIIAEKFETTLDRGEFNGRMRDLFDIYFLYTTCSHLINKEILKESIINVSKDRNTTANITDYHTIIRNLSNSKIFKTNFYKYKEVQYPKHNINLDDVFVVFTQIYNIL